MATSASSSETAVEAVAPTLRRKWRPWRPYNEDPARILAQQYKGHGTQESPFIVEWLRADVENPKNWPAYFKWWQILQASMICIACVIGSSSYGGITLSLQETFGASDEVITLGIALYVLALAPGPLLWSPTSEVTGRRNTTIATYLVGTLFNGVAVSSQNIQSLIIYRFFISFFTCSTLTNAGGLSADLLEASQRGLGLACFSAAAFLGPPLGPMIAGWLDFRWQQRFLAIFTGVCTLAAILFWTESYSPVLLRRRAAWLEKQTGKVYRAPVDANGKIKFKTLLKKSLKTPWIITLQEPIVLCISIYLALVYSVFYLFLASFPVIFEELRGWTPGQSGLAFTGILIGIITGSIHLVLDNRRYVKHFTLQDGHPPPEVRLPPAIFAGFVFTVGLAWFAGTCGPDVFWVVSIIATIPIGHGYIMLFICYFGYLIDSYVLFAASVLAGQSASRSIVAACFPLFTIPMYHNLGPNWASSIPAFLSALFLPMPVVFYRYGPQIRQRSKFAARAAQMLEAVQAQAGAGEEKQVAEPHDEQEAVGEANLKEIKEPRIDMTV